MTRKKREYHSRYLSKRDGRIEMKYFFPLYRKFSLHMEEHKYNTAYLNARCDLSFWLRVALNLCLSQKKFVDAIALKPALTLGFDFIQRPCFM